MTFGSSLLRVHQSSKFFLGHELGIECHILEKLYGLVYLYLMKLWKSVLKAFGEGLFKADFKQIIWKIVMNIENIELTTFDSQIKLCNKFHIQLKNINVMVIYMRFKLTFLLSAA